MSRSVSAVSMARSESCRCPPRLPTPTASQVAIASGANHTVLSPRWTSARSYAGQFPTWYFVLYFGCTLDFMSRSCLPSLRWPGCRAWLTQGAGSVHQRLNAVSIAQSENVFGAPGRPDGDGRHASVASAESHSVTSPRWTKACSYADQFPTRYFVLYFGMDL